MRDDLARERLAAVIGLRKRLERTKREGDLPERERPADLAFYVWTVLQGMAVQATTGATLAQLRAAADLAMRAWPAKKGKPTPHRIVSRA